MSNLPPSPAGLAALVADDVPVIRQALCAILRQNGVAQVHEAANGAEALALIETQAVDVIFCDLSMPQIDGVEFLRKLPARHNGTALVLLSGEDEKVLRLVGDVARKRGLNLLGTLTKPITAVKVRRLLGQLHSAKEQQQRPLPAPLLTAEALDQALAQGHIEVHYLPTVRISDRVPVGVEALSRWRHPERGLLEPELFIPLAESSGRIHALTLYVARRALAQAGIWRKNGLSLEMAINISAAGTEGLNLPEAMTAAAADSGQAPETITLELTETEVAASAEMLDIVSRLRLKGFKLAIDDFGTGRSSLVQLRQLPFTELKIDRSFVHNAMHDPELRVILESSLDLARRLRMHVVAEGVETRADWELLAELRCDAAQGYWISPPIPDAEIPDWAKRWKKREW